MKREDAKAFGGEGCIPKTYCVICVTFVTLALFIFELLLNSSQTGK